MLVLMKRECGSTVPVTKDVSRSATVRKICDVGRLHVSMYRIYQHAVLRTTTFDPGRGSEEVMSAHIDSREQFHT